MNETDLVQRLVELGVTLPDEVVRGADQSARLVQFEFQTAPREDLLGLTDDELGQELERLGVAVALAARGSAGPGGTALDLVRRGLADAIAGALRERLDDILDQLRPTFDAAARIMFTAVEAGIHAGTDDRAVVKAEDFVAARAAWTAIPAAVRTLETIGEVRIGLSTVTGAPPVPGPSEENVGAAFRTDGRPWRHDDFEQPWQRWLRLSVGEPARLLALSELPAPSEAAA